MVSSIIACTTLASTAADFFDALIPMKMPKECDKKIYALGQYTCLAMTAVAVVGAIFAFVISSAPFFVICAAFVPVCIIAAYSIKNLALLRSIQKDADNLQQIDNGFDKTLAQYKTDNASLQQEVVQLQQHLKELDQQKADLTKLQETQSKENLDLKANADKLAKLPGEFGDKLTLLTSDVQTYAGSLQTLTNDTQSSTQEVANLQSLAGNLQETAGHLKQEDSDIATQIQQITSVADTLHKLFKSMISLNHQSDQANVALAQNVATLQKEIDTQKSLIAELHAFNTSTDQQLASSAASKASADALLARAAAFLNK